MPNSFLTLVVVLISLLTLSVIAWGTFGFSQVAAASRSPHANVNPPQLLEWVGKTGRPTVVRANIARAFGLADHDIPVKERGFHVSGEQFTHVCSVGSGAGYEGLLFLASVDESDGRAKVWRMSQNGRLLATVTFDGVVAEAVLNSRFASEFAAELDYFVRRGQFGVSPSSPAPPAPQKGTQSHGVVRPPRGGLFQPELMLTASGPLALPAILAVPASAVFTVGKTRRSDAT